MSHRSVLALLLCYAGSTLAADSVLVMRHCVRAPYPSLRSGRGAPGFDSPDNYTAQPFPTEWNVSATAACTSRGITLSSTFGAALRAKLPGNVSLRADNVTRNMETATALSQGLGHKFVGPVTADGPLFDPVKNMVCPDLSTDAYNAQINGQLAQVANASSINHAEWMVYQTKLAELQGLVGKGSAPPMDQIALNVSGGYVTGGLYVASEGVIETFILEAGSGLSVSWGALDGHNRSKLYNEYLPLRVLYGNINHGGVQIAARNGGPTLWYALQALGSSSTGSEVLVGHDLTLDGIASLLGLTWQCGEYPRSATPPMSGLLFTKSDTNVQIQAVCSGMEEDAGSLQLGSVMLGGQAMPQGGMALGDLQDLAKPNLDFDCIQSR